MWLPWLRPNGRRPRFHPPAEPTTKVSLFIFRISSRFRSSDGNALISAVMSEILTGELYDSATSQALSMRVAEEVRARLKGRGEDYLTCSLFVGLGLEHYKYIIQVNLSEQRGQAAQ